MNSLYQGVYLVLNFDKQFHFIPKQVNQSESFDAPFVGSLSSSQQPCQWDHTQNKQQWRLAMALKNPFPDINFS